jgi:hypothetical protein
VYPVLVHPFLLHRQQQLLLFLLFLLFHDHLYHYRSLLLFHDHDLIPSPDYHLDHHQQIMHLALYLGHVHGLVHVH